MKKKHILILLFTTLTGFNRIQAQANLILSLDSAQRYALDYNKTLKNAGLAVDAANKKVFETQAAGLPQVDANMDYTNFLGAEIEIRFGEDQPPTRIPFKPTSNLTVTVGQLIFSGSYLVGIQTAKIYRDLSESGYEKTELDIKEQVAGAYYSILIAEKSLEIITKNLGNIKDVYNKTNAMYSVGMAEITDVDQLAVQVTLLENAVKSSERQVELAYNLLRLQLGVDAETSIKLTNTLTDILIQKDFSATLAQPFVLSENLDFRMMKTQELLSEKQINMEKMSFLPTLTGFYSYTEKVLRPDFDMTPPNLIGLQMSIPIFSSGMRKAKLDQAKIEYKTTLNNKGLLIDQLMILEKQYRFNLNTTIEQYESQKNNVEVSKRVFNNINLKYQQGLVSSLDLTTANNNYLQAETNYISSLMQLLNAQLALDKLLNRL
jgi:outer membrane protein